MKQAQAEFDSIIEWLRDYDSQVNHSAFLKAADTCAILAAQEAGIRTPDIRGLGLRTLDFAACLLRTYIPSDIRDPLKVS